MIEYRMLRDAELVPELFLYFRRHQEITHCWRKTEGQWEIYSAPRIIENWGEKQREFVCEILRSILSEGGMAAGAFCEGELKGFVSVEGESFGSGNQYLAVPFLHVSQELRGQGIGRALLTMAKVFASEKGIPKLYLSTQPSIETQAFYKAMGCTEAEEYNMACLEHNPRECQLELTVADNVR